MKKLDITEYKISDKFGLDIAIVADLHKQSFKEIIRAFNERRPDIIFIPGDLCNIISTEEHDGRYLYQDYNAITFLCYARYVAPVYYVRGNHECQWNMSDFAELIRMGIHVLENSWEEIIPGLAIGGLTSAQAQKTVIPSTDWLKQFEQYKGYKILLSHHPEYYQSHIKSYDIDLIVSGHAHGGHVRIGNHGLYAPGQGFFPKYTSGINDNRLVVSRGICRKPYLIPSFNNPPELVYIKL